MQVCTTFEERIVVTGGNLRFDEDDFNTVEAKTYDINKFFLSLARFLLS